MGTRVRGYEGTWERTKKNRDTMHEVLRVQRYCGPGYKGIVVRVQRYCGPGYKGIVVRGTKVLWSGV